MAKRKRESDATTNRGKRVRLSTAPLTTSETAIDGEDAGPQTRPSATGSEALKPKRKHVVKLAPARPFPTVPRSVSATGPRSAHKEGKNLICITRKTTLGAYMRRCKNVLLKDGYTSLQLSAMGAAIPLLLKLTLALPPILPFDEKDIHVEYKTDTVEVQDEIIPEDDDEEIQYETRGKSTLLVVLSVPDLMGDGITSKGVRNGKKKSTPAVNEDDNDEPMEAI